MIITHMQVDFYDMTPFARSAVFFSHLALDQIKTNDRKKGLGLTVAALVIGYAQTAASVIF